jgi:hypothetical protein
MIENLKNINDRNIKLEKMPESDIEALYLRVFNSEDGELVMQDLANRAYVFEPTENEKQEGMRALYLSIQSRLQGAVSIKKAIE